MTDDQRELINSYMAKEVDIDMLPEPLRAPTRAFREHIDALSQKMIDIGAAQGEMVATIMANKGIYWTRSYEVFDNAEKWPDIVQKNYPQVYDKAIAAVRQIYTPPPLEQHV